MNILAEFELSSFSQVFVPFLKSLCGMALLLNVVIGCMSLGANGKVSLEVATLAFSAVILLLVIWVIFDCRLTPLAVAVVLSSVMGCFSFIHARKWAVANKPKDPQDQK